MFAFLEYELNEPGNECSESDVSSDGHMDLANEEADEVCSLNGPQYSFKEEETKSRFTEYSMSSSIMRRNEQLTLLDNKFEKVYIYIFLIILHYDIIVCVLIFPALLYRCMLHTMKMKLVL